MIALLGGVAFAGLLSDFGAPVDLGIPGRHGRPVVTDDGQRWLGLGRSGSFHVVALNALGEADPSTFRTVVSGDGEFIDHSFVPCEDGGFLHIASGNRETSDDTAWASFVGRDLTSRGTQILIDADPHFTTNDMPVLCVGAVWATAFATEGDIEAREPPGNALLAFGPSLFGGGGEVLPVQLPEAIRMTGTSMIWRPDTRQVLMVGIRPPDMLRVVALDEDLVRASISDRNLDVGILEAYWAQSSAEVEGSLLIAHMVRNPGAGFAQDTGNVALTLLGPELQPLETKILTDFSPPDGAMRPALVVSGEEVIVSFDVGGALHTMVGRVDREALADIMVVDAQATTGAGASPPLERSSDAGSESAAGCSAGPERGFGTLGAGLLLVGLCHRRRS